MTSDELLEILCQCFSWVERTDVRIQEILLPSDLFTLLLQNQRMLENHFNIPSGDPPPGQLNYLLWGAIVRVVAELSPLEFRIVTEPLGEEELHAV